MTNTTSLVELKTASPPAKPGDSAQEMGFGSGESFNLIYRVAAMFAQSTLVPKHYQGNVPNCMIALNMAHRLGADPLMVAQNLYVVHGTPAWSAQFLIATFNKCGRFSALRYEFQGQEGSDKWGCRAVAIELASGDKLTGPLVTIDLAKKEGWYDKAGSKWKTMPEQMLRYRSAAWFVRAYAPEIAMGLHMAEEILDARPNEFGAYESTGPATITAEDIKANAPINPPPAAEVPTTTPAPAPSAPPDTAPDISRATLDLVEKELTRLGVPNHLPPELAGQFGTGDPSELTEAQGNKTLRYLKAIKE